MKCTLKQYVDEVQEISFPFKSAEHEGVVIEKVPGICDCKNRDGFGITPAKGVVREFIRCIEFDYAVYCTDCKRTRAIICRYYPGDKIWKMKFEDNGWVNIIDASQRSWASKIKTNITLFVVIVRQIVESIKNSPGNKIVHGVVLISKLLRSAFQRGKR